MIIRHDHSTGSNVYAVCDGCAVEISESNATEKEACGVPAASIQVSTTGDVTALCAKCSAAFQGTVEMVFGEAMKRLTESQAAV